MTKCMSFSIFPPDTCFVGSDYSIVEDIISLGIVSLFFDALTMQIETSIYGEYEELRSMALKIIAFIVSNCEEINEEWFSIENVSALFNLYR